MLQAITHSQFLRGALLRPTFRTTGFQPLWNTLHRLSLWGMNMGPGGGVESSGEQWVLQQILRDRPAGSPFVLFDVGANKGQYATEALALADADLNLYCFEPSPPTFQKLTSAVGGKRNVKLHNFGMSSAESEATLHYHVGGDAEASLVCRDLSHWGIAQNQQVTVKLRRLDEVAKELGVQQIDFLKLDVEGHELAALQGAGAMLGDGSIRAIQFEFGGPDIESRTFFKDLYHILNPHYTLFRIVYEGLDPVREYSEFLETFVTGNYLAVSRLAKPQPLAN